MSAIKLSTPSSGSISLSPANTASNLTITVPAVSGTMVTTASTAVVTPAMMTQPLTSGTAVASTSGTSIDFTGIPSWVKRITVMFNNVSTNGSSFVLIQLGDSGGIETTGYAGASNAFSTVPAASGWSSGIIVNEATSSTDLKSGLVTIALLDSATNNWAVSGLLAYTNSAGNTILAGNKALSATLDRIRITTVNGTDAFDAGSINILYE